LVKSEKHGLTAPFFICVEFCKNEKLINEKGTFCHKFPHFLGKGKIIPISEYFWKLFGHISTFGGGGGAAGILLTSFCAFWTGYTNMSSFNAKSLLGSSHVTQHQNFEKKYWLPSPNSC
jgi:hypothetical protein